MEQRYVVKEVRATDEGAGGFVVVDSQDESEWGLTLWRDVAERLAARWNAQERALTDDVS